MRSEDAITIRAARANRYYYQWHVQLDDGWYTLYWRSKEPPADDVTRPVRVVVDATGDTND